MTGCVFYVILWCFGSNRLCFLQREGKRNIFLCHSTELIHPNTFYGATGADCILYKPIDIGVLYLLKFKNGHEKQHSTVNNYIMLLDETLKVKNNTDATSFVSINDNDTLPGSKVLSFGRDGRRSDPLYRQFFNKKDVMLPGVKVWKKEIEGATEQNDVNATEQNDVNLECALGGSSDELEDELIGAGGSSTNGKQRVTKTARNGKQRATEAEHDTSHKFQSLGAIADAYASDSEFHFKQLLYVPDKSRVQLSDVPDKSLVDPLSDDENSKDSTMSMGGVSSCSLSPTSKELLKKFGKQLDMLVEGKETIDKQLDMLVEDKQTRDYLVSTNERKDMEIQRKDMEIEDHKHKRKSQEGKTAAQTRKVNVAIEGERKAQEKAMCAEKGKEMERKLREKSDAEKSTLMIANAGMSNALTNFSTGNKVILLIFRVYSIQMIPVV
jgi:hypothetical protein